MSRLLARRALRPAAARLRNGTSVLVRRLIVLESRATPVSDDLKNRTTSHAKTVDLVHQKNALDRALSLKEQFDRAKTAQQSLEQEKIRQGESAAHTAHAPRPQQHLRPKGPVRLPVDKPIDRELLAKEALRAQELYKERQRQQKMLNVDHDRDKDNSDRSR